MTRRVNIYTVYQTGQRVTCHPSAYLYAPKVTVSHVGAYSMRQAYYLVSQGTWGHPVGILESAERGGLWTDYNGALSDRPHFERGQVVTA